MAAITALALSPNDFKVRWREPYVSEALNRKFAGVVPRGIYSGFALATHAAPLTVKLVANASSAHVAVYESLTAYSLTINRSGGDIVLNMAAFVGQTVYVVLYAVYSPVIDTVAEIRLYSEADYNAAPEKPELIVFGTVNVPGAGVIPASAVSVSEATLPWKQAPSASSRAWVQIVKNGSFDGGDGNAVPGFFQTIPGFTGEVTGGASISVNGTNPRSGISSLELAVNIASVAKIGPGQYNSLNHLDSGVVPVRAGQLLDVSLWIAGTTVAAYTDGTSGLRLIGRFYDALDVLQLTVQVASDAAVHVGTFPYAQLFGTFTAPVAGYFVWYLEAAVDIGAGPSTFYVDDLRIFLQPQASVVDDEGVATGDLALPTLRGMELDIVPTGSANRVGQTSDVARITATANPLFGTIVSLTRAGYKLLAALPRWDTPFIYKNPLEDTFGFGVSGTDSSADLDTVPNTYKLVHAYQAKSTGIKIRVYTSVNDNGAYVITYNARWSATGANWTHDITAFAATRLMITRLGVFVDTRAAAGSSWVEVSWIRGGLFAGAVSALSLVASTGSITAALGDLVATVGNARVGGQYNWTATRGITKEIPLHNVKSNSFPGGPSQGYVNPLVTGPFDACPTTTEAASKVFNIALFPIQIPNGATTVAVQLMFEVVIGGAPPAGLVTCNIVSRGIVPGVDRDWSLFTPLAGVLDSTASVLSIAGPLIQIVTLPWAVVIDNDTTEYSVQYNHFGGGFVTAIRGVRVVYNEDGLRGV